MEKTSKNNKLTHVFILDSRVNVLRQYVLSNPYVVVHSVSPGVDPAFLTSVPLHKGRYPNIYTLV